MVCLDTDFIVALLRKNRDAEEKLRALVKSNDRLTTTPITASELFKGAYASMNPAKEASRVRDILSYLELLDYSVDACERFGKIVNELKKGGVLIGDLDTIVASIALTHNQHLLTKNTKHFENIHGLITEGW